MVHVLTLLNPATDIYCHRCLTANTRRVLEEPPRSSPRLNYGNQSINTSTLFKLYLDPDLVLHQTFTLPIKVHLSCQR